MELKQLKGIGEKTEKTLNRAGIEKVEDLLDYYPRYYDTYEEPVLVRNLEENRTQAVLGTVVREISLRRVRNRHLVEAYIRDLEGNGIKATWFNAPYIKNTIHNGDILIFRGFIHESRGSYVIDQPKTFTKAQYQKKMGKMQPVYPLVSGLTNNIVIKAVKQAFSLVEKKEYIPKSIREKFDLINCQEAIKKIHFPVNNEDFHFARKRLVFEEFFRFIVTLRELKENNSFVSNHHVLKEPKEIKQVINNLDFTLTDAQMKTWNEIKNDMASEKVMNRLVQGDVGSGKTIVAILGLLTAALNGEQGVLMAPTEVLARQHYEDICELIKKNNLNLKVAILVGSMKVKEKREAYEAIETGYANIIIGTHALIQEKVKYRNLALVVTDEQHRFGVKQRETIAEKGDYPHTMVMSATPIPRTLAIIMYGDLDISIIDQLPSGRKPIANCVVGTDYRPRAYDFIEKQIAAGRQAYVICPTVEYSEAVEGENVIEYAKKLQAVMPPSVKVDFLHGRMKPAEKNEKMNLFAENKIQILVSTTVVEVGVNVPNATVMMVENAERFGLAQLHQLRGRVGRGKHQSYCIFINGSGKKDASNRLDILNRSNDGFYIASEDLKLRGPGDFFGVRQSGDFEFKIGDIMNDAKVLKEAAQAADLIENNQVEVTDEEKEILKYQDTGIINI